MNKGYLLPRMFRVVGLGMAATGLVLSFIRYYFGYKPGILNVKVFALYSKYLDTKVFQVINNQLIEEVSGFLIVIGIFLAAFSKMKTENDQVNLLRLKSFQVSSWLNILLFIIGLFFIYGLGYVYVLIISSISWLVIYFITFSLLYRKNFNSAS